MKPEKNSSGFYINTRVKGEEKLYKNGQRIEHPFIAYFEPEERENIKNWREIKDMILFKMQKGELIYGKPMTDKELNQFSKITFEYFKSLKRKNK